MGPALAIQPKHEPLEPLGQEIAPTAQAPPQVHEPSVGDVAPLQLENPIGLIQRVQPDAGAIGGDMQGELGPVPPVVGAGNDRGIRNLHPAETPECLADEAAAGVALSGAIQMLQLTAAAVVANVVRAARRDTVRSLLQRSTDPRTRKTAVPPDCGQLDQITRRGPGDEHRHAVFELADAVPAGGEPQDANGVTEAPRCAPVGPRRRRPRHPRQRPAAVSAVRRLPRAPRPARLQLAVRIRSRLGEIAAALEKLNVHVARPERIVGHQPRWNP